MGLIAWLAVILTLDGPGLTVDEPLDVRPGRTYLTTLWKERGHFFDPAVVDRVFGDNAEHPPLGRWLLGIASMLGEPFEVLVKGPDPSGYYVLSGRLAPASTFGLLVGVLSWIAGRRWGRATGVASGFTLATMPRVFAHAHLGALDTFLMFFWTLALLAGEQALRSPRPVRAMMIAGAIWSLALLTKIHAWFLLPILGFWSLLRMPIQRAVLAMTVWLIVGISLFWAGWPWLWTDSWSRLWSYWGTGVTRATIQVLYFGRVYADRDVPWHYAWVYFATTVPIGFQVFGIIGIFRAWKQRRVDPLPMLLLGSILFFLILFSTRVPVYDGERLFLHVFPAWAMLVGLGFRWLLDRGFVGHRARLAIWTLLIIQGFGVVSFHPFGLSYYNALVGGLPGARKLGMELTYWSDAIDDVLLNRLAGEARPGAAAAMVPTLYPGQGAVTTAFNRTLARRDVILQDDAKSDQAEWVVLSHRTAYWRTDLVDRLRRGGGRRIASRTRQGVELSALWHFPAASRKVRDSHLEEATHQPRHP